MEASSKGGLGLGSARTSAVLATALAALVVYTTIKEIKMEKLESRIEPVA